MAFYLSNAELESWNEFIEHELYVWLVLQEVPEQMCSGL